MNRFEQTIDGLQFLRIWFEQTASSISELPADPNFRQYHCRAGDIDLEKTFPAFGVNWAMQKVAASTHEARSISYSQLVAHVALKNELLAQRSLRSRGRMRPQPHLIVEHCKACDRRVIKDGCKEFLNLVVQSRFSIEIVVTEVAGTDWSTSIHDMRLVCDCQ